MKFILTFLFSIGVCYAQSNYVYVDQIGDSNQVTINQDSTGHVAAIAIGAYLPTYSNDLKTGYGIGSRPSFSGNANEFNTINITQQGVGTKTSTVEVASGSYNNITTFQDGTGNHTSAIQNLQGNSNNINIFQDGAGNHTMNIIGGVGTTNTNDIVNSTQTGAGDKSFTLNFNGSNGAQVTIQQTNPTQPNAGSMTIQCTTCGAYSYIRQ